MRKHISYAEGTKTSHESRLERRVFAFLSAVNLSTFIKTRMWTFLTFSIGHFGECYYEQVSQTRHFRRWGCQSANTRKKKKKKRLRKLGNIRKVPKLHRMIAQRHAPLPNCPQIYAKRSKSSYS